jgi:hypothetical protein
MTSQPIEWNGDIIALLDHGTDGDYLVPPIVLDTAGGAIMGLEVLAANAQSGVAVQHPVLRDYTVGRLAELERELARTATNSASPS